MEGVKIGKVGKSEISQTDEESNGQDEGKVCKSIIKSIETRDIDTEQPVKEMLWHEVRTDCEQELKYLRDFGVCEKIDEREAIAQCQVTPVDTKWIDTNEAFEEEPITNCCKRVQK